MRKFTGIEIARIFFACIIPLLHIPFTSNIVIDGMRQYISRLGVPFFFAVSGMFLSVKLKKNNNVEIFKTYSLRVARVLLIWLAIYVPLIVVKEESLDLSLIQKILFKTPAYLWYLTSLLFAAIPFCFVKNRKALYVISFVLYVFGTVFGDTYRWLIGGIPLYEEIFITTRNGLFFGLALMCIGELTWKVKIKETILLLISGLLLMIEITVVGIFANSDVDRSMYIFLPCCVLALLSSLKAWNPNLNVKYLGGISTAIYVMQFGIITILTSLFSKVDIENQYSMILVYVLTIFIPVCLYLLFRNKKIVHILF